MIKNIATKLNDVKLFEINFHKDNRGSFTETFNKQIQSLIGDNICFVDIEFQQLIQLCKMQ